ncbi:MAG: type II toxin-antitoxin system VapC family toxin [Spirochaetes bacterium]|nr:type II toxin-antitoxin system VapC family toxin [Spirochaetota bacterium]
MNNVTHLLDTSALLAHYFDEPGADVVEQLWATGSARPGVSAVTVAELKQRLGEEMSDSGEAREAADAYLNELTVCLPVDRMVAELACQLMEATAERIPLVDALIAATARAAGAVLVHRDPHFERIPRTVVDQIVLPMKIGKRGGDQKQ